MDEYLHAQFAEIEWAHWWFVGRRQIVADVLGRRLPAGAGRAILDVGCGAGAMVPTLARHGSLTATDSSPQAIEHCRATFAGEATFAVGLVPDAGPGGGRFDLVTAFDVIEHLDDDVEALSRIRAVLEPDGLFVCTVPAYQWMWGPHDDLNHHRRRYTRPRLRAAIESAGLEVERITYFNSLLLPMIAGLRLVRRVAGEGTPRSDFTMPSAAVNRALRTVFGSERFLLRAVDLPAGVSLLAVCRRRGPDDASGAVLDGPLRRPRRRRPRIVPARGPSDAPPHGRREPSPRPSRP